jgi:hypothetical protein
VLKFNLGVFLFFDFDLSLLKFEIRFFSSACRRRAFFNFFLNSINSTFKGGVFK